MKKSVFPRMAVTGFDKNRKLYIPYILSCMGMVTMYYIVQFISVSPAIEDMKGGANLRAALSLGKFVVAFFALIFLLYTNSFLIRRRNREFGLYSILGVNKKGLVRIITWETMLTFCISVPSGTALGVVFSKLAQLLLLRLVESSADFSTPVSSDSLMYTLIVFAVIFSVMYLKSVIQVFRSNPLQLLKNENTGEKEPKANTAIAIIGAIILTAAYAVSVFNKNPISALFMFFIDVILVIIATYMLFISGSVVLCKMLRKNKSYYYKKNHFVSVSSMTYRMKRNGAGLASICILSTMVLVMLASSASLYFGKNQSLNARYPHDNEINVYLPSFEAAEKNLTDEIKGKFDSVLEKHSVKAKNLSEYHFCEIIAVETKDGLEIADEDKLGIFGYGKMRYVYFITVDEYNRITGESTVLKNGEALMTEIRCSYKHDSVSLGEMQLEITGELVNFCGLGEANANVVPSIILVVPDYDTIKSIGASTDSSKTQNPITIQWSYTYDIDADDETVISVFNEQIDTLETVRFIKNDGYSYNSGCRIEQKDDFVVTFGGLFFIGIILSIVFVFAQAMIIYYKQISEGYEDEARFAIMRNVGMTVKDIKKSINSQILTVFFAPLLFAGIHYLFAFPPIWKILQLFNLANLKFVIIVSVIAFCLFGVCYAAIYKLTAQAYYKIVSSEKG